MAVLDNVAVARYGFEKAGLSQALGADWHEAAWQRARANAVYLLDALGIAHTASARAGGLAYGIKRKVEIARALALEPSLLLLDEPAAGLNEDEQIDLADRLRTFSRKGLSILVIEHNMPFLMPLAQRIICLDHGVVIAEGTPAEIRANPLVIEATWARPRGRSMNTALLEIEGLAASYGQIEALRGVSLRVGAGEAWRWWAPTAQANRR